MECKLFFIFSGSFFLSRPSSAKSREKRPSPADALLRKPERYLIIYRPARCSAKAGAAGGGRMPPSLVLQHAGILPGRFSGPSKGFFPLAIRKAKIHYSSEAGAKSPAISAVFFVFHLFRAKSSLVKLIPKHPLLFPSGRFRFSASGIPAISGEFPPLPSVAADPRSR